MQVPNGNIAIIGLNPLFITPFIISCSVPSPPHEIKISYLDAKENAISYTKDMLMDKTTLYRVSKQMEDKFGISLAPNHFF